jgi:hypothetical protein
MPPAANTGERALPVKTDISQFETDISQFEEQAFPVDTPSILSVDP